MNKILPLAILMVGISLFGQSDSIKLIINDSIQINHLFLENQ